MPLHRSSKMAPGVGVAPTSQRFGGAVAAAEHARVGTRGQVGPQRQMVPSARLERARSREHQPLKLAGLPGSPTTVKMVRSGGVEPPRPRGPPLLRRRCMPVPSRAQKWRRGRGSNSPGQVAPSDFQSVAGTRPAASPRNGATWRTCTPRALWHRVYSPDRYYLRYTVAWCAKRASNPHCPSRSNPILSRVGLPVPPFAPGPHPQRGAASGQLRCQGTTKAPSGVPAGPSCGERCRAPTRVPRREADSCSTRRTG